MQRIRMQHIRMQPPGADKRQRSVSLIDLGEIGAFDPGAEPELPPRPSPRWAQRLGVPAGRKAAAVGALALVAGGLAGTAPPATPPPHLLVLNDVTVQASLWVVDDTLVQVRGDGMVMTATDLNTGAITWTQTIGQAVFRLEAVGNAVAVQTGPTPGLEFVVPSADRMTQALARGRITVVDARTGVQRWQHRGALIGPFAAEAPLVMFVPSEDFDGTIGRWFLVGVDPGTGRDVWSEPSPDGAQWTFRGTGDRLERLDPTRVTIVAPDGTVRVLDTATGQSQPMGRLPADARIEWSSKDLLGVRRPDPAASAGTDTNTNTHTNTDDVDRRPMRFEVYELSGLDSPLWSRPMPRGDEDPSPHPCEPDVLCQPREGRLDRIDVRTGAPVTPPVDDFSEYYIPGSLGVWEIQGSLDGLGEGYGSTDAIAFVSPYASRTKEGWMGLVRLRHPRPEIVPLAPVPLKVDGCWLSTTRWLVCPGTAGTIVIRQSEVQAMIAASRPDHTP